MLLRDLKEFASCLSQDKRIMSLDFGMRKVGIAFSDKTNLIAIAHGVYVRRNTRQDIGELYAILKKNNGDAIVIGFPLELDGQESELCQKVETFANQMIKRHKINVYLHDERYTTAMATNIAKIAKIRRKGSQVIDDKVSAVLILQQVLDMMNSRYRNQD